MKKTRSTLWAALALSSCAAPQIRFNSDSTPFAGTITFVELRHAADRNGGVSFVGAEVKKAPPLANVVLDLAYDRTRFGVAGVTLGSFFDEVDRAKAVPLDPKGLLTWASSWQDETTDVLTIRIEQDPVAIIDFTHLQIATLAEIAFFPREIDPSSRDVAVMQSSAATDAAGQVAIGPLGIRGGKLELE